MTYAKVCLNCSQEFKTNNSNKIYCSFKCGNKYRNKKHYKNNPEYYEAKRKSERLNKTEAGILARIKSKAKRENIPFNLTIDDIQIPKTCPVLNISLTINKGHKGYFDDSPSIDRIKPELGYLKGNIRIISNRANLLKNNATVKELELVLKDLRGIYDSHI